jgi:LPXTG-motif cell wall-anchored protein
VAQRRSTHDDRANHRARVRVFAAAVAATGLAFVVPASSAGATDVEGIEGVETCTNETYVWTGRARLGDGTNSVDTAVGVPAVPGTRLDVVGTSADGIDAAGFARALPVSVGGTAATTGATVPGGSIVVSFDGGASPVDLTGATVVVRRCTTVASSSPAGGSAAAAGSAGSSGAAAPGSLPRTGGDDTQQVLVGSALVAIGTGMVAVGRRRRTA